MKGAPSLKPIQRENLTQVIRDRLIDLVWNQLEEGEKLPSEKQLAEQLHVGRSSLREVLRGMVALGIVEVRRGSGYFATKSAGKLLRAPVEQGFYTREQSIAEIVEARAVFEHAMASLIVERITEQEIAAAAEAVDRMKRASNLDELLAADVIFHQVLYRATKNSVLFHVSDLLYQVIQNIPDSYLRSAEELRESYRFHAAIFDSLRVRDAGAFTSAISAHSNWITRVFGVGPDRSRDRRSRRTGHGSSAETVRRRRD